MFHHHFLTLYQTVRPTVLRLRKLYRIQLWEQEDWEQEGMITLFELLQQFPELGQDLLKLRVYFKTKFSNRVNDMLRQQESQKRQFNKLASEDIADIGHLIPNKDMLLDDYVAFQDSLEQAKLLLTPQEQEQLDLLTTGRAFKGRTALIRKLRQLM